MQWGHTEPALLKCALHGSSSSLCSFSFISNFPFKETCKNSWANKKITTGNWLFTPVLSTCKYNFFSSFCNLVMPIFNTLHKTPPWAHLDFPNYTCRLDLSKQSFQKHCNPEVVLIHFIEKQTKAGFARNLGHHAVGLFLLLTNSSHWKVLKKTFLWPFQHAESCILF